MGCNCIENCTEGKLNTADGAFLCLAQPGLDFREAVFDWVQVWAVWRQVKQSCPNGTDKFADTGHFVAGKIIHDDNIALL